MRIVTESRGLEDLCRKLEHAAFVTVDTEFIREKTFWPRLCLVQIAGPEDAVVVDPLADGLDLAPLFSLLRAPAVLKVFHSARQDVEIFCRLAGEVPTPLFDTQLAAMVCGFGDSVAYETLVARLADARIDKTQRFTDWSRRPLTKPQLHYALSDVTHLRAIYENLAEQLERTGRTAWLDEEMAVLTDPQTYENPPQDAWRRLKFRRREPRYLAILREVAAWREREAQARDLPRVRVLRDEALVEIAAHVPTSANDLAHIRRVGRGFAKGPLAAGLLDAVTRGGAVPEDRCPRLPPRRETPKGVGPMIELLKVLLKMKCESYGVAHKLVATVDDLERIAMDDGADLPALSGWRREVFGEDALALKSGRIALAAENGRVTLIERST